MPTPWSHHDGGRLLTEGVRTTVRRDIIDSSADGIEERELTADDIGPRRTGGVLLIGQPHPSTRVQCIDRHSAIGRTRDLHATVLETGSGSGDAPRQVLSDHPGPGQEVEPATVLDPLSTLVSLGENLATGRVKAHVELAKEIEGLVAEDLVEALVHCAGDEDLGRWGTEMRVHR